MLSTNGGDSGEFFTALYVFLSMRNSDQEPSETFVYNALLSYIKQMPQDKFYVCTDDDAVEHLKNDLEIESLNIQKPKKEYQRKILSRLNMKENIGD